MVKQGADGRGMGDSGAFRIVAVDVAEAVASIQSVEERHAQAAARLWINIHTLLKTHPLTKLKYGRTRWFVLLVQKIAMVPEEANLDQMETISVYTVAPWYDRIQALGEQSELENTMTPHDAT